MLSGTRFSSSVAERSTVNREVLSSILRVAVILVVEGVFWVAEGLGGSFFAIVFASVLWFDSQSSRYFFARFDC